jgi:thiol-disulfide isomerase/thioredoxin
MMMERLRWLAAVIFTAAAVFAGIFAYSTSGVRADSGLDPERLQDQGAAPELTNNIWINSDKPLRLADLRGKVVLLDFWTFGCINCQHTLPYLKEAYAKYKGQGVEFIGIHYPEFSYERDVNNVRDAVQREAIAFPVAIDNDGAAWNAYQMHAWPAFVIVDKFGRMRFRQIGEGRYDAISAALDTLLAEPGPTAVF